MQVDELDPGDDAAFAEWFAVLEGAERSLRPDEPGVLHHEERRISLQGRQPDPDLRCVLLAAREAGRIVGVARSELPQRDNLHLVELELAVAPDARRRGVGRALVQEAERLAQAAGRTTVVSFADEPPGFEGTSPGRLAALALGYEVCQEEVRRDIDLPLDPERAAALTRSSLPHASGYTLRTWVDRCPDDLVEDRAELSRVMSTDVPLDRLDWREEVWDAARVRRFEDLADGMDRTTVNVGAVHTGSGSLVAYTQLAVPRAHPERAYQWDTLVRGKHRGHRLGALVKLRALGELSATSPATRFISTWNAQENAHMISVNDALGARTNGRLATVQRVLG